MAETTGGEAENRVWSYLVAQMYICNDSDDKRNKEKRLIATCRATSDHAFNACLWDIIVDPEYQGQGLGKADCLALDTSPVGERRGKRDVIRG